MTLPVHRQRDRTRFGTLKYVAIMGKHGGIQARYLLVAGFSMLGVGERFLARRAFLTDNVDAAARNIGVGYILGVIAYAISALCWWWLASSMGSVPGRVAQMRRAFRGLALQSFVVALGQIALFRGIGEFAPKADRFGVVIVGTGAAVISLSGRWETSSRRRPARKRSRCPRAAPTRGRR